MSLIKFNSVLIIGMGLIGSSLSRSLTHFKVAKKIYGIDNNEEVIKKCEKLNLLFKGSTNIHTFNNQFDLIIICSPLNTYKKIFSPYHY